MTRNLVWLDDFMEPMEQSVDDGVTLSSKAGGGIMATSLYEVDKSAYRLQAFLEQDASSLEEVRAFLRHLRGRLNPLWIIEPRPKTAAGYYHSDVLVGWGDTSTTAFHMPFYGTPTGSLMVDGVVATQTSLGAANQLNDLQASPDSTLTGLIVLNASASIAYSRLKSYYGQGSVYVNPAGSLTNYGVTGTAAYDIAASPGDERTMVAWVSGTSTTMKARLQWLDAAKLSTGVSDSANTITTASGWTKVTVTGTAPASTAWVRPAVYAGGPSTEVFWVDCLGVCPGPYNQWWLPSYAPRVIEFSSAPGNAAKITASVTAVAQRLVKCHIVSESWKRQIDSVGNERYLMMELEESLP